MEKKERNSHKIQCSQSAECRFAFALSGVEPKVKVNIIVHFIYSLLIICFNQQVNTPFTNTSCSKPSSYCRQSCSNFSAEQLHYYYVIPTFFNIILQWKSLGLEYSKVLTIPVLMEPASHISFPGASWLGRICTGICTSDCYHPRGSTGDGSSDSSHCFRYEESRATLDAQTHFLMNRHK